MCARATIWVATTAAVLVSLYIALPKPTPEPAGPLPHADHTPKHGGVFFMAPNGFHHVEGVLVDREFRLYLYDDFTRPMDVRPFRARVGDRWLAPDPEGAYLALQTDHDVSPSGEITAFVRFRNDRPEDQFDFVFLTTSPPEPKRQ